MPVTHKPKQCNANKFQSKHDKMQKKKSVIFNTWKEGEEGRRKRGFPIKEMPCYSKHELYESGWDGWLSA